jgi:16S rRNA pseudouridine516 synthase
MSINHSRLDKFIAQKCQISRRDVRLMLAKFRVQVDGVVAKNTDQIIHHFSHIMLDETVLQANTARYIMLHKPVGVVSATKDIQHKTVIDLLDCEGKEDLHIVGRLDLNTSGLVLLTNDSRWSERITEPSHKIEKLYCVTLQKPLTQEYVEAFAQGMYFEFEDITTRPAKLTILSENMAQVVLVEGRYHQIKRMFGRFRNPVVALHRQAIGSLFLDNALKPGESRELTPIEVLTISD